MDIKPLKTDSDYQISLSILEEIFDAPVGSHESDEADILGLMIDDFENQ